MAKVVGLTGGIASGKSTISKMFLDAHIPVIDTDQIAHALLKKGTRIYDEVVKEFKKGILHTNEEINRKKLGRIVFSNTQKRERLNEIVHPEVLEVIDLEIEQYQESGVKLIVIDVPLLYETNFHEYMDAIIVVYATLEQQLQRLMDRDNIDMEYAEMRVNAQMPLSEKVDRADYVIDNSKSVLKTKKEFNRILEELEVDINGNV